MGLDQIFYRLSALSTPRLRLRTMVWSDLEAIFAFKSDPKVTRCYAQEPHRSLEETRVWVQRNIDSQARHEGVTWVLSFRDDPAVIGECCLWNFAANDRYAEMGYELLPKYWHQGLMTEALTAVLTAGFVELGLHRIEALPPVNNQASIGLLSKLGFKQEGRLRQRLRYKNEYLDQFHFGLLKEEWAPGLDQRTGEGL